jgi:glycosyltransferase involved in cell wall biosynthesis
LPFFPLAIQQFNLASYDLVISSDASVAKGVRTNPMACHLCYCHTPIRYAWSAYEIYRDSLAGRWQKIIFSMVCRYLRNWDRRAASLVTHFMANSQHVSERIRDYYHREAKVIYPPVAVSSFPMATGKEDYFLAAGEMVPYKRFDLAVEAFNQLGLPLYLIGDGTERCQLEKKASGNIHFRGRVSDEEFQRQISRCRALIFPGEEDFGMVAVEALACGRPVIALAKGGALEIVTPPVNGLLFGEESSASLTEAVLEFQRMESQFDPGLIRQSAQRFRAERFREEALDYISAKYWEHQERLSGARI